MTDAPPEPEPSSWGYQWTIPEQTPDTRLDSEVCGMCVRSLKPRRAVCRHRLPICRACASMPNDPRLVDWWMGLPRYKRRAWITVAYGVDPVDKSEADVDAQFWAITEDVDGMPTGMTNKAGNHAFGAGQVLLPVNTFWELWRKRPGSMGAD